jgi:hypothetical protein
MCYNQKEECIDYVKDHMPEIIDNLIEIEKNKNKEISGNDVFEFFKTIYFVYGSCLGWIIIHIMERNHHLLKPSHFFL